jgi:hypothetical protein
VARPPSRRALRLDADGFPDAYTGVALAHRDVPDYDRDPTDGGLLIG